MRAAAELSLIAALLALAAPLVRAQEQPAEAPAPSALELSQRGLALLEQGKTADAIAALEQAAGADDASMQAPGAAAITRYNLGVARSRAGDFAGAADALAQVEQSGADPELLARARFNRGHALFSAAQQASAEDAQAAVDSYLQAAEAFRLAAALDGPEAQRAARAMEISRLAAKRLQDQIQREQERQQQAQQMADQLRDLAERQQQLADQTESRAQQQQPTDDLQQQQEQLQQETEGLLEQLQQMARDNPSDTSQTAEQTPEEGARDDVERATGAQQDATDDLRQQRPADAPQDQQRAAELLRQAAQRLSQQQGQQQQGEGQTGEESQPQQQEPQQAEGEQNQAEQRDTIADALLDKERAEREARERARAVLGQILPVEKDW